MSVSTPDAGEVCTCRNCGGTARKAGPGTYPVGWYGLTVSVPEWYCDDGSGRQYLWMGLFCSVACLLDYGPQLQANADLAHEVYEPAIPTPAARSLQGVRTPRR